jgi:tripartite-type tricarboxylate transporter receptor subunit TctC
VEEKVRRGNAPENVQRGKTGQERHAAGHSPGGHWAFVTASVMVGTFLLIGVAAAPLGAQSYPNKPIRFILPYATGGGADILGRIIGPKLAERLGQPVVPENRAGAGGNVGTEIAAKARPDGYTLILCTTSISISPGLYKKLNYDPVKDLAPISLVAQIQNLVLVRPSLPVKNLKEFVEYARANPRKLNFTSGGVGTSTHLAGELLKSRAKIDMVHVSYKGGGPALIGLMGGEADIMVLGLAQSIAQIQAGKVRAIAVLSEKRLPSLPDVPMARESGIDNCETTAWYGLLAPAGTPRDIIRRLNAEWVRVAAMPDTIEKIQQAGCEPIAGTPEQFSAFLQAETERWSKVIKEANIKSMD